MNHYEHLRELMMPFADRRRALLKAALVVGEYLLDRKAELEHGAFLPWLTANCPFGKARAEEFMRLYEWRSLIVDASSIHVARRRIVASRKAAKEKK